ncbi:hypothetical protein DTO027B5_9095 [Paecilomyces variotii]|nr:hypothetical protein DTO169C6_823 [Paecilomyces variotii]KAJ9283282.1 hypothetical protein DTO021C3_9143 [Paecilomyces variotii]KAJ9319909.1 hypothetical protein DTO027B3_9071 [Paecilomyces variotii]KAJ9327068.1 hypothetical protein DTO027B5_9095 [Paecilomyces variotii]KAJ9397198.1 hypothetical protein DTO282F9_5808 [Paecilomyces variotii]
MLSRRQSFSSSSALGSEDKRFPSPPLHPHALRLHAESQHLFPQQFGAERGVDYCEFLTQQKLLEEARAKEEKAIRELEESVKRARDNRIYAEKGYSLAVEADRLEKVRFDLKLCNDGCYG